MVITVDNERMELDKDILSKGNKIYCPEKCIFVPKRINCLIISPHKTRGKLPLGVNYSSGGYVARLSKYPTREYLGIYDTPEKAFYVYKTSKEKYIKDIAEFYKNKIPHKLYKALYNYKVEITD